MANKDNTTAVGIGRHLPICQLETIGHDMMKLRMLIKKTI